VDAKTAQLLCSINNDFYRKHCVSFSETRQLPWLGWTVCLDVLKTAHGNDCRALSIFDLACGNLRFEAFLSSALPGATLTFHAVDNCDSLVPASTHVNYQSLDILDVLQQNQRIGDCLTAPACDLAVAFGFMHHVPLQKYREQILLSLVGQTHSGGYVLVSFWQFLNNEAMGKKARVVHERARKELSVPELNTGDYLLGWKNIPGAYRYCHSFSDAEIDQLIGSVAEKASLVSRFVSDGRTNNLNAYLILKVH
jgi:hypothetical protein